MTDPAQPYIINGGSRPIPDPTVLTDAAIAKASAALTQYIDGQVQVIKQQLTGIEQATGLRLERIDHIPDQIDIRVATLRSLTEQRFTSVQTQFSERDTRAEREAQLSKDALDAAFSASKEAVAAALTAQKEASALQNEAFVKAIDKSELATAETISKLAQLSATTNNAISDKIDDLKERVNRIESTKVGATENRSGLYATIGFAATVLGIFIIVAGLLAKGL